MVDILELQLEGLQGTFRHPGKAGTPVGTYSPPTWGQVSIIVLSLELSHVVRYLGFSQNVD